MVGNDNCIQSGFNRCPGDIGVGAITVGIAGVHVQIDHVFVHGEVSQIIINYLTINSI